MDVRFWEPLRSHKTTACRRIVAEERCQQTTGSRNDAIDFEGLRVIDICHYSPSVAERPVLSSINNDLDDVVRGTPVQIHLIVLISTI
jgi:hypothetical protein